MTDAIAHSDEERAAHELLTAAAQVLADDRHEVPAEFVTLLFERALPEDLMRYDAREIAVLAARGLGAVRRTSAGYPAPAARDARGRRQAAQGDVRARSDQRRHAVPGRFGDGGAGRPWPRCEPGGAPDLHRRARFVRPLAVVRARAAGRTRHGPRELHPCSPRPHRRRGTAQRPEARDRGRARWMSASACRTGARCWTVSRARSPI